MGITIHYKAIAKDEEHIQRLITHYQKKPLPRTVVDFAVEPKWIQSPYIHPSDYDEHWEKYVLSRWANIIQERYHNTLPKRYKGIILDIDEGCEPLWLCFGKYDKWCCHNFTKTQYAKKGILTHMQAVNLIKELHPFCTRLEVSDEAEYYETEDVEVLAKNFMGNERAIKVLGEALKDLAKDYNLKVKTLYEEPENV